MEVKSRIVEAGLCPPLVGVDSSSSATIAYPPGPVYRGGPWFGVAGRLITVVAVCAERSGFVSECDRKNISVEMIGNRNNCCARQVVRGTVAGDGRRE
jgi:hypothetical protein